MNGQDALRELGIDENTLTAEQKRELDEKGFFVVTDVFTPEEFTEIGETFDRLQSIEGDQDGYEVHTETGAPRLSNILNKSTVFDKCLEIKPLLAASKYLLGDEIKIYEFNIHDASLGRGHQQLHSDVPEIEPDDWRVVNSLILVDPLRKKMVQPVCFLAWIIQANGRKKIFYPIQRLPILTRSRSLLLLDPSSC